MLDTARGETPADFRDRVDFHGKLEHVTVDTE
jgi:hypothetical protein